MPATPSTRFLQAGHPVRLSPQQRRLCRSAACRRSSSSTPSPSCRTRSRKWTPQSLENLPIGLDGSAYQWIDLHGEGIPGILTEQAGAWFYKRNLSPIPAELPTVAST